MCPIMTEEGSEANETVSGHRRIIKVTPMDEGARSSGADIVKCSTCPRAAVRIGGSGVESPSSPDESSDQPMPPISPESVMPQQPIPDDEDTTARAQELLSDCGGNSGQAASAARLRRTGSLPPQQAQHSASISAAVSNRGRRYSDGMISASDDRTAAKHPKRVSFGRLSVRKYPIVLGDHPDCSCGPPVTMDWNYREFRPVDVDEYETRRPARRNEREMILPYIKRREILTRVSGHTEVELTDATREAQRVKKQRKKTVNTLQFQRVEEAVQTTMRGLRKLRPGSGSRSTLLNPGDVVKSEAKTKDLPSRRKSKRCPGMDGRATEIDAGNRLKERHRDSLYKARAKMQPQRN